MGLLRDYLIKDPVMKRRVTMAITIAMMLGFVISLFIPQIMGIPYQQGKDWAKEICLVTEDDLKNMNMSEDFLYEMDLAKTP
jgi:hypothetical protein